MSNPFTATFRAFAAVMAKIESACVADADTQRELHLISQMAKLDSATNRAIADATVRAEELAKWKDKTTGRAAEYDRQSTRLQAFLASRGVTSSVLVAPASKDAKSTDAAQTSGSDEKSNDASTVSVNI